MVRLGQLCMVVLFASAALFSQDQPPSLKIYVYNHAGVSETTLARAEDRASTIFRQSGVTTSWYTCAMHGMGGANCSESLDRRTVRILIVHDTQKATTDVLGTSFLGTDGYGSYADIFFDRAQQLCRDTRVGLPDILGHIISHEIGHLLLGIDSHSRIGIMRAKWDSRELEQADRGRLLFLTAQSKAIQKRLIAISSEAAESAGGR